MCNPTNFIFFFLIKREAQLSGIFDEKEKWCVLGEN